MAERSRDGCTKKFLLVLVDTASKNLDQTTPAQSLWDENQEISWTLASTPTKQDLLNEEVQKLAVQTHFEVQQREDIRRGVAERMKFVPPDLRAGEHVFYWQEDPNKIQQGRKSGKWLKVEIISVKGSMAVVNTGAIILLANISKLRRLLDTGFGRTSGLA